MNITLIHISSRENTKIKNEIISTFRSRRTSKIRFTFNNDDEDFDFPKFTKRKLFFKNVNFHVFGLFDFIEFC